MIQLYPFQQKALDSLWMFWKENPKGSPLIVAPTGAGKSLLIAKTAEVVIRKKPQYRIMCVAHRKELLEQNSKELQALLPNEPIGIWSAGLGSKTMRRVTYAGIQSIYKTDLPELNLVMIDEAHLIPSDSSTMYQRFIKNVLRKSPHCKFVGLTATPFRLDSGSLIDSGSLFTDIAYDIPIDELIRDGYLAPILSCVSDLKVDMSGVAKTGFDYNQGEMQKVFEPEIESHCTEIIAKGGKRKRWLIFCSGVEHARKVAECLRAKGVPSEYVSGEMVAFERDMRINDYKSGKTKALVNCNILTTGFNDRPTDLIALLRSTMSASLYIQMVGRVTRTAPGKDSGLVLDFGGNIERHGPIDMVRVKVKKQGKAEIIKMPTKVCGFCGCVVALKVSRCPSCDNPFPAISQKLDLAPSKAPILAPPDVVAKVVSCVAKRHQKDGSPDSLKIEYTLACLYPRSISEYFPIEHDSKASWMAKKKWAKHMKHCPASYVFPITVDEALKRIGELNEPEELTIRKDQKFYRIHSMSLKDTKIKMGWMEIAVFRQKEMEEVKTESGFTLSYPKSETEFMDEFND